ncbi:hypothetical protein EST38_g9104 [Candolleomyces aberdarensis]|uniref:Uncharacterized protein n=1 Tax=Candolleomyces aberdarensis TaxID=2316362 RepID=A0A4Q2DAR8_9AGAR|nr:hypothetical protein EST38_g9104 [Candolleomyces aberdarensis]
MEFIACRTGKIPEGSHTLEVIFVGGEAGSVWFDRIEYLASPTADLTNEWSLVPSFDKWFQYPSGWKEEYSFVNRTQLRGALLTYDFTGTDIIWGGYIPGNGTEPSRGPGFGSYTIDGQHPFTHFVIPSNSRSQNFRLNQEFFSISGLPPGPHRLEVINEGDETTTSLALTHIYTKHSSSANQKSSSKVIGGAVGGGLGLILVLVLVVVIAIRRRRRHQSDELGAAMDGKSTNAAMPGNAMTQTWTSHATLIKPKDGRVARKTDFEPSDLLPGPPIAHDQDPGQAT